MKRLSVLCLALVALGGVPGDAQSLKIRLLNGGSGKPIGNTYVNVWVGDRRKDTIPVSIGSNGEGALFLTNHVTDVLAGDVSGHPVQFPYASEIKLQFGFVLCQAMRSKDSWLLITTYSADDWARTGIVTPNTCGKAAVKSEPGVLTIFARPLTFWEKLSE